MKRRRDRLKELEELRLEGHMARDIALIVAGIGIGSGIALLAAPGSGEETRHAIGRGYRHTVRRLGRGKEDLRERLEDFVDRARLLRAVRLLRTHKREVERRSRAA